MDLDDLKELITLLLAIAAALGWIGKHNLGRRMSREQQERCAGCSSRLRDAGMADAVAIIEGRQQCEAPPVVLPDEPEDGQRRREDGP